MAQVSKAVSPTGLQKSLDDIRGKSVKNLSGADRSAFKAWAWENTGGAVLADNTDIVLADFVGVNPAAILNNAFGLCLRTGNVPGALASMSAYAGQEVYLGTAGALTLIPPTAAGTIVFRVGFAAAADGATGLATDLWLDPAYLIEN